MIPPLAKIRTLRARCTTSLVAGLLAGGQVGGKMGQTGQPAASKFASQQA